MSTVLKGNKHSTACSRVPTHLLESAIAWEDTRVQVFTFLGRDSEAQEAAGLKRNYERRLKEEADLH